MCRNGSEITIDVFKEHEKRWTAFGLISFALFRSLSFFSARGQSMVSCCLPGSSPRFKAQEFPLRLCRLRRSGQASRQVLEMRGSCPTHPANQGKVGFTFFQSASGGRVQLRHCSLGKNVKSSLPSRFCPRGFQIQCPLRRRHAARGESGVANPQISDLIPACQCSNKSKNK